MSSDYQNKTVLWNALTKKCKRTEKHHLKVYHQKTNYCCGIYPFEFFSMV